MEAQQASNVMTQSKPGPADTRKLRVAVMGIGWWSDVLADAALRSDAIDIVACYTRSDDKRAAFAANYGCRAAASYEEILTDREFEVLELIGQGKSSKEIARQLHISGKTVAVHSANVRKELNLKSTAQLIRFAVQSEDFKTLAGD